ncbi:MAG TPA: cupin domain-containing protein [Candidatus Acidoferrales bacterium]|nr:cupin domain-containing protein [Candidatus Acidoferrales bacterium]
MAKPEIEFSEMAAVPWTPVQAGSGVVGKGISEKVLSRDESGDTTRLLRLERGVESDEVITHDFWEEVIILEGSLIDKRLNKEFTKGMYACRPPGMIHGPYKAPQGCTTFEIRYFKK